MTPPKEDVTGIERDVRVITVCLTKLGSGHGPLENTRSSLAD